MKPIRFSLSNLFLVILAIALSLGWWIDRRYTAKKCKANTDSLKSIKLMVSLGTDAMIKSVKPNITRWRDYNSNSIEDLLVKCKEHANMLQYIVDNLNWLEKNAESVEVK